MEQIAPFEPQFHLNQMAEKVEKTEKGWKVITDDGVVLEAPVIVVAAGGGSFMPKKPPIPGIEDYEGKGVFYAVKRMEDFRDKKLVIAGGGDSALDWTLSLKDVADHVTLVHRRPEFRGAPATAAQVLDLADKGEVDFVLGQPKELRGEHGNLEGVVIKGKDDDKVIDADCFLPFFGLTMKLGPLSEWGFDLKDNLIPVDTEKFETSQKGIFAIGDINWYPGKLKLILSGFHEAALMAHAAKKMCIRKKRLCFSIRHLLPNCRKC
jgi:thioredoxin reductase (NADPH)